MKKRLLSLVLTLAMVLSFFPGMTITASAEDTPTQPLSWTFVDEATNSPAYDQNGSWDDLLAAVGGASAKILYIKSNDNVDESGSSQYSLKDLNEIVWDLCDKELKLGGRLDVNSELTIKNGTLSLGVNSYMQALRVDYVSGSGDPMPAYVKLLDLDSLTVGGMGLETNYAEETVIEAKEIKMNCDNNPAIKARTLTIKAAPDGDNTTIGTMEIKSGSYSKAIHITSSSGGVTFKNMKGSVTGNGNAISFASNANLNVTHKDDFRVMEGDNAEGASELDVRNDGSVTGYNEQAYFAIIDNTKDISTLGVPEIDSSSFVYDGTEHKPTVTIQDGNKTLEAGEDYTVVYENNINAGEGTATMTVTGVEEKGYTGTVTKNFSIAPCDLVDEKGTPDNKVDDILLDIVDYSEIAVVRDDRGPKVIGAVKIENDAMPMTAADYVLSVESNAENPARADVTVTFGGNYTGEFVLRGLGVSEEMRQSLFFDFDLSPKEYNGQAHTIEVKPSVANFKEGEQYTVTYSSTNGSNADGSANITDAGTVTVTIAALPESDYVSEFSVTYNITRKPLEVEWSNTVFAYDGNPKVPTATLVGVVEGDEVIAHVQGAAINAREAAYTATLGTENLSGAQAGNYSVNSSTPFNIYNLTFYLSGGTTPVDSTNVLGAYLGEAITYGENFRWSKMPTLVGGLTAKLGEQEPVVGTQNFALIWDNQSSQPERPKAGDQGFTVVFNGKIGEVQFNNVPVTSGTVRVNPGHVEIVWHDLLRAYTGGEQLPSVEVKVLEGDTVEVGSYFITNGNGQQVQKAIAADTYTVYLQSLSGEDASNYTLVGNSNRSEEFTIETIKMKIDGEELTADNILDNYDTRVYGDTWADMPDLSEGITATLGGETCDSGSYRLVWDNEETQDIPAAGEQGYKVLFTGTLLGVNYTDAEIFTGSIEVEKRILTIGVADDEVAVRAEMPEPELGLTGILMADLAKIADIIRDATVSVASGDTSAPNDFAIIWESFADDKAAIDAELANNYNIAYTDRATMHVIYDTCLIRFVDDESSAEEIEYWSHGGQYPLPSKNFFRAPYLYRFAAWDIEGERYNADAIYTVTKDVTVEAVWEDIVVTGEIDKNALIYDPDTGIYTLPDNEETVPVGKRFGGWLVNDSRMPAGAVVDVNVDLEIVHYWQSPEYRVTLDAFDLTGRTYGSGLFYIGDSYTLPDCMFEPLAGKQFVGWIVDGELMNPGNTIEITGNMTVLASWTDKYPGFTVSGKVVDKNGAPVAGATVTVIGSAETTNTDINGNYVLSTILPGIYNFVVTKDNATTTVLKEIGENGDAGVIRIDLGDLKVNLEVKPGTPTTVVGGLEAEAEKIKGTYPPDRSVNVEMTVVATVPETEIKDEIEKRANSQSENLTYIEIDINKQILVDGTVVDEDEIEETDDLLKIMIEFETEGRRNFAVYRYHEDHADGDVQKLVKSKDQTKERIEVGDGVITMYVKYFSTYAIGYSEVGTGGGYNPPAAPSVKPEEPAEPEDDGECKLDNTCPIWPYTDASTTAWYHDGVHYCIENGLMNGVSTTRFVPNGAVTRQQVWMVLARLSGAKPANMAAARAWAMENGVSDGTNPTKAVTRQQFITMLYRYAVDQGYDVSVGEETNILSYADAFSVSEYAIPAMQWGCGSGIMGGYSDGTLKPTSGATRAHLAAFLQRFCEGA